MENVTHTTLSPDTQMRAAVLVVPALADDVAVVDDDRADDLVRMRRPAAALGKLDRAREVIGHASSCTRRR